MLSGFASRVALALRVAECWMRCGISRRGCVAKRLRARVFDHSLARKLRFACCVANCVNNSAFCVARCEAAKAPCLSKKDLAQLTQVLGLNYSPSTLLFQPRLRGFFSPTKGWLWDWMHCLVSHGIGTIVTKIITGRAKLFSNYFSTTVTGCVFGGINCLITVTVSSEDTCSIGSSVISHHHHPK